MDKRDTYRRAERAMRTGSPKEGLQHLWSLVTLSHLSGAELQQYLNLMYQAYLQLGHVRGAVAIDLFFGRDGPAIEQSKDSPIDLARSAQKRGDYVAAAKAYEEAKWFGHAAIQLENSGNFRAARVLWQQLGEDPRLHSDPYIRGLVYFNLGRACRQVEDPVAARKASIQSIHFLESAADGFETRGMRERAFDCYQVLMTLGKEGPFENLAEGYLNCIRILREDNLKYYVLQYYEDFQALAIERGELHAAATLFREAADYARRQRMPYSRFFQYRGAETYVNAALKTLGAGGPATLAENSFAAAIDGFNELGQYSKVCEIYGRLSELPLPEKRCARYQRLQERLSGIPDDNAPMPSFPEYLRHDTAYPEIWRLDMIEWEQGGNPAETMLEVVMDDSWPDFTRRRALICCLAQFGAGEDLLSERSQIGLAHHLGRIEIYASLAPLEKMYESESAKIRAACLKAVRQLFFKRSFVLIAQGLSDEDRAVRTEALAAVSALHFPHAFDPLQRIYREYSDVQVRRTALDSIGKIPTLAAIELLIEVLCYGENEERDSARTLLSRVDHPEVVPMLTRLLAEEQGPVRVAVESVLSARGR